MLRRLFQIKGRIKFYEIRRGHEKGRIRSGDTILRVLVARPCLFIKNEGNKISGKEAEYRS